MTNIVLLSTCLLTNETGRAEWKQSETNTLYFIKVRTDYVVHREDVIGYQVGTNAVPLLTNWSFQFKFSK